MAQHIAFLRAINVGGHIVKMEALRAHFAEMGFAKVRTFIQTGNVIFDAPGQAAALEKRIEVHLLAALGYEVETFIRTLQELKALEADVSRQFTTHLDAGSRVYIGFLRALPTPEQQRQTMELSNDVDIFSFGRRELYWLGHKGMGESTMTGPRLGKALGASTTTRNITSVRKLIAMCEKLV